ncbi:hypothetical protein [Terricaulis sp.]|uniref:hypothetical protein n=1 Tax=Terricaulis sp. TaxID=2768686 RepID=UPI003784AA65
MRSVALALIAIASCASAPVETAPVYPALTPEAMTLVLSDPQANDGGMRNQTLALLGREDLFGEPRTPRVCPALMRDGAAVDPVREIVRLSEGRRLVIINEAHDNPQNRAFIADVAVALRHHGFSLYAAETFAPSMRTPARWPRLSDGYYVHEPAYGALLRRAHAARFRFFEYEFLSPQDEAPPPDGDWAPRIARREAGQAANLQRILAEHPHDRMLIHVGYGHLQELPDDEGRIFMAQRLKEATGIDPLTVDITRYASPSESFVFCDPAQTQSRAVDFRIGSPALTFTDGRPSWRQRAGQRPLAIPPTATELTVWEARRANEPDEAVPVDRLMLRAGERLPLLLSPGRYRLRSWTQSGGYRDEGEIRAPD